MRGAVFHEVGKEEITYHEDIEVGDPGPGEVRVRIHAAGVCHSDLSAMNGTLPQPAPAVLGHEGAGEIVAVGEGVPTSKVGDHVIIAWTPPCGVCDPCLRGEANLCISIFFQIAGPSGSRSAASRRSDSRDGDLRRGDGRPDAGCREDPRRRAL